MQTFLFQYLRVDSSILGQSTSAQIFSTNFWKNSNFLLNAAIWKPFGDRYDAKHCLVSSKQRSSFFRPIMVSFGISLFLVSIVGHHFAHRLRRNHSVQVKRYPSPTLMLSIMNGLSCFGLTYCVLIDQMIIPQGRNGSIKKLGKWVGVTLLGLWTRPNSENRVVEEHEPPANLQ